MVEPPCTTRPPVRLTQTARARPIGSMPGWCQKRRSSTATAAAGRDGGMSFSRSGSPTMSPKVANMWPVRSSSVEARPARRIQRGFGPRQVAGEPQHHDGERQHAPDRGDDGVAEQTEAPASRRGDAAQRCARVRERGGVARERGGGHAASGRG